MTGTRTSTARPYPAATRPRAGAAVQMTPASRWPPTALARDRAPAADAVAELADQLLHSLSRADQRRSGELYIRGLLAARGRKTMRNIASVTGQPADAQRLHHFISDSTWDWAPVRHALARQLGQAARPSAWLLHSSLAPRGSRGAVGADCFPDPDTGGSVNSQRAVGLWAVTAQGGFPVDWELLLSARWLDDARLRERAGIPADAQAVDAPRAGLNLLRSLAELRNPPYAPVLLDARRAHPGPTAAALASLGFPYLLRISGSQLLEPAAARGRRTGTALTARELARPCGGYDTTRFAGEGPPGTPREVTRVSCRLVGAGPRRPLVLLAARDARNPQRAAYWLSDLVDLPTSYLVGLLGAPALITADAAGTGRSVGLYDFEGRSFDGWHRHITLASVAHAAAVLLPDRGGSTSTSTSIADVAC